MTVNFAVILILNKKKIDLLKIFLLIKGVIKK